jgi:fatty acid desaturase
MCGAMYEQDKSQNERLADELEKIRSQTQAQMQKSRAIDYIAIVLALAAVFILWLLQWMGLY